MPNQFKDFEEYRIEVRVLRVEENHGDILVLCEEYLKTVKRTGAGSNMDYWFIYHNKALAYKKMNNINKALKFAMKALSYIENDDWCKTEQTYSLWLLAVCYKEQGKFDKALYLYKHLLSLYRELKKYQFRICVLYNYAEIKRDTKAIENLIKIYQSEWFTKCLKEEDKNSYNDLEDSLYKMYNGLIKLYVENGEREKIFPLIVGIQNKSIKRTLMKQITA